ncbi:MAG: hypothetical protein K2O69_06700, partial [Odoribacter sp.]|nr:hypothetical protein [Odoribacter sp.]
MGKIFPDVAGAFTNALGGTVYYVRNGENLVRRKGKCNEKKFTDLQKLQQSKFSILNRLGNRLKEVADVGFPQRKPTQSGANMFVRANKDICRVTEDGEVAVDLGRMLCAQGRLAVPALSVAQEGRELAFTLAPCEPERYALPDDRVMVLVFEPECERFRFGEIGVRGKPGRLVFPLPKHWKSADVRVYVF